MEARKKRGQEEGMEGTEREKERKRRIKNVKMADVMGKKAAWVEKSRR